MFISKLAATGLFFSGAATACQITNNKSRRIINAECEGNSANEQSVADLDKIFAGQDGGLPPDPEEIQEMIMKAQGKLIRYKKSKQH